jgi:hypothetical protein
MKDKKYKHADDLIEDYLDLTKELEALSPLLAKEADEYKILLDKSGDDMYKKGDLDDIFKQYIHIKKLEEKKAEVTDDLEEVKMILKDFLSSLQGHQISYDRKEDGDKSKTTYIFWEEKGEVKTRQES